MSTSPGKPSVEQRLQALEDEHEILRTISEYAHALIYGEQEEEFLDCFTEDGIAEPRPRPKWIKPSVGRAEGREQLRTFYRNHAHAVSSTSLNRYFKHVTGNTHMRMKGDTAEVDSFYVTPMEIEYDDGTQGFEVHSMGRYRDTMVRCPDGRWRIQKRLIEIEAGNASAPNPFGVRKR